MREERVSGAYLIEILSQYRVAGNSLSSIGLGKASVAYADAWVMILGIIMGVKGVFRVFALRAR